MAIIGENPETNCGRMKGPEGSKLAWMVFGMVIFMAAGPVHSQSAFVVAPPLFSDGFENYNPGSLDANLSGSPNQAFNGGPGNPWFGSGVAPNLQVYGAVGGVTPHSGGQMIGGRDASDFDTDWLNMAYRFNGGTPFYGNLVMSWWFYDPAGAGSSTYMDYSGMGFSSVAPNNQDYTAASGGNLNSGPFYQMLSLGANYIGGGGLNPNEYQAEVLGATNGANGTQWFNLPVSRTVGWHEAAIVLGTPGGASTAVSFYIDNLNTPLLTEAIGTTNGLNVIDLNSAFGSTYGYYDDLTLSRIPEPGVIALLALGALGLVAARWRSSV